MGARDEDLEEAVEILSGNVEENNREIRDTLRDHDDRITEIAHYARRNRDRIEENFENIDDLWDEVDNIYDEIDDNTGETTYIDFTGIENTARYIGGGIRNFIGWGSDKADDFNPDKRKTLKGTGALLAGAVAVDYSNVVPGDENAGDGLLRLGDCGGDIDGFGRGEQEKCAPSDSGGEQGGGSDGGATPGQDTTETGYGDEVQTFTYEGNKAIDDGEFGSYEELLDEYDDNAALEEMLTEDYTEGDVFVAENDRVYAGGGQASVKIDGVWEDVKDGEVDGE